MGMADIAEVLWNDHLKHNPTNSNWADRDRFVFIQWPWLDANLFFVTPDGL